MSEAGRVGLGIICALIIFVTVPKLHKMAVIVGWLPGAVSYQGIVTEKWESAYKIEKYHDLSWHIEETLNPPKTDGNSRANYADWERLEVGSFIRIVAVGKECFYEKSIYTDTGNFAFDFCLLAGEVAGIIYGFGGVCKELWKEHRAKS